MSAVLRAYGEDFDVDAYLEGCTMPVCAVQRRGQPVFPLTQPNGRVREWSCVNVVASDADFDELPRQAAEATAFLRAEHMQVQRLCSWAGVERVTLDFGVDRQDAAVQCYVLPAELVRVAGSLGLALEISQYPTSREDPDDESDEEAEPVAPAAGASRRC